MTTPSRAEVAALVVAVLALSAALALAAAVRPIAVLIVPLAAGAGLLLLRPAHLLLVLVAILPWEDALSSPAATLTPVKVVAAALLAAWVLAVAGGRPVVPIGPALSWAGGLCAVTGLSLIASPDIAIGLADASRYASFVLFAFLVVQLMTTLAQLRVGLRVLVLSTSGAAAWALLGVLARGDLRAGGPIGDPNDFAFLLVIVLPIAGYLIVAEPEHAGWWRTATVLMVVAVLATLSRGALAGLGALALWGWTSRRIPLRLTRLVAVTVIAATGAALVLWRSSLRTRLDVKNFVADANADVRRTLWRAALEMAGQRPLVGVGPGRFVELSDRYLLDDPLGLEAPVAHNAYLQVLAELGLLGAVAFAAVLVATWALLRRAMVIASASGEDDPRRLAVALQGSMVTAVVTATFLSVHLASGFWLLAGLATALVTITTTAPAVAPTPALPVAL